MLIFLLHNSKFLQSKQRQSSGEDKEKNDNKDQNNNKILEEEMEFNFNRNFTTPPENPHLNFSCEEIGEDGEEIEESEDKEKPEFTLNPLFDFYMTSNGRKRKSRISSSKPIETEFNKYSSTKKSDNIVSEQETQPGATRQDISPQNIVASTDKNNNMKEVVDDTTRKVKRLRNYKHHLYSYEYNDAHDFVNTSSPSEDLPVLSLSTLIKKSTGVEIAEKQLNSTSDVTKPKKQESSKKRLSFKNIEEYFDKHERDDHCNKISPAQTKMFQQPKNSIETKFKDNERLESHELKLRLEKLERRFNAIDNFLKSQQITNKELLKHREVSDTRVNGLEIYIKRVKQYLISKKIQKVKKEMSNQEYRRSLACSTWEAENASQKSNVQDIERGEIAKFASCREPGASGFEEEEEDTDVLFNGENDIFGEFLLKHRESSNRVGKKDRLPLLLNQIGLNVKKYLTENKKQSNLSYSHTLELLIKKYGTNSNLSREYIKKLRNLRSVQDDTPVTLRGLLAILLDMRQVYQIVGLINSDSIEVFIEHIVQNILTEKLQKFWRIRIFKLKAKAKEPTILEFIKFIERKVAEDSLNEEETEIMMGDYSEYAE